MVKMMRFVVLVLCLVLVCDAVEDHLFNENPVKSEINYRGNRGNRNYNDEYYISSRQNPFGLSNINSAVNPVAQLLAALPQTNIPNPNFVSNNGLSSRFSPCDDGNGLTGSCVPSNLCVSIGGRPSGACGLGTVCCISSISRCGGQATLNNTFWRSPPAVSSDSSCSLTVTLDTNLIEQRLSVCQVRLDFIGFTIAQPAATSVCNTDTFVVGGVINRVPIICGENPGQHMYLTPPSSTTDLILLFTFGQSNTVRSWNMKISFIPCGSRNLAPPDCLQYFTAITGPVMSFNWRDIAVGGGVRQLANQRYKICFRNEILANTRRSTRICYGACSVPSGGTPFLMTGAVGGNSQAGAAIAACRNDFLFIPDSFDVTNTFSDRYCGGFLNPAAGAGLAANTEVCSTARDYFMFYSTNGDEVGDTNNPGFCVTFTQRN